MITVNERQRVCNLAFRAVKALYGIQEKLRMTDYYQVKISLNTVESGWFLFWTDSGNYYRVRLDDRKRITTLQKGRIKVVFD